jgi:hypothetical protein
LQATRDPRVRCNTVLGYGNAGKGCETDKESVHRRAFYWAVIILAHAGIHAAWTRYLRNNHNSNEITSEITTQVVKGK